MLVYDKIFEDEQAKKSFTQDCDTLFVQQVLQCADNIAADANVRFILLSGPTCSGKTSAAALLREELIRNGRKVRTVSIDDFYRNSAENRNTGGNVDYESINAIDYPYFVEVINRLCANEKALLPVFDFISGMRSGYQEFQPDEDSILLFEGIQVVYPEITSLFTHDNCKRIFISVGNDVLAYGKSFSKRELRFSRRIVRDFKFRGTPPEVTFMLWKSVCDNEDSNIYPYVKDVDTMLNSFVPYEINVMAPIITDVLSQIKPGSEYYVRASEIIGKYRTVQPIKTEYVMEDSFFREFIGEN